MTLTNYPNGISSFGIPVIGDIPPTFGNVYFVDYRNGSDGNTGKSTSKAFKTLSKAYGAAVSNNNDVILIDGDSTVVETAMIDWTKNRVHVIGLNGVGARMGNGAKVSLTATATATNIATLKVTGVRNTFSNIKWMNASTVAEGIYCVADGGEFTRWYNCEFYKSTDLDVTGAAELLCNGDSCSYVNCAFGSTVNAISGAIIRPCVLLSRETITGKVCRDTSFINCLFMRKCGNTANRFVYGAGATDVERMLLFDNCIFWNTKLAAAVPAQNVALGATQTEGEVLLNNCISMNAATAMSTTTGVFVNGPTMGAVGDTVGIAIQCS